MPASSISELITTLAEFLVSSLLLDSINIISSSLGNLMYFIFSLNDLGFFTSN